MPKALKSWQLLPVLSVIVFALATGGCSDDSTGPGGGGGGGGGPSLAAGTYDVNFTAWTCGQTDTVSFDLTQVNCATTPWSAFLDIGCSPTVSGNSLSLDCSWTEDQGGCQVTRRVTGNGTKTGNTWVIDGQVEITSQNPPDCSSDPVCEAARITITETGPAPSACQYASPNTVAATIGGGPLAGKVVYDAFGFPTAAGNDWSWMISGLYDASLQSAASATATINASDIFFQTPVISGTLPQSFGLILQGAGRSAATSAADVLMAYAEYYTDGGTFLGESASSGQFIVNVVSGEFIAGTFQANISGTQYSSTGQPTPASRSVSGGYFVTAESGPFLVDVEVQSTSGLPNWLRMARSR